MDYIDSQSGVSIMAASSQTEKQDEQAKSEVQGALEGLALFNLRKLTRFREEGPFVQVLSDSGKARLILFAFKAGQQLKEHTAASQIIVQALRGRVVFSAGSTKVTLQASRVVQLEERIPHSVVALTDAVVLVILVPGPA
jgi:quercetin dioxygenase-like cupin family protein